MQELKNKDFKPDILVDKVIHNPELLSKLISNLLFKDDTIRYNSHKVILLISENNPELLYTNWEFFVDLLNSKNNFHKVIGIQILANLTKIDTQNRFEGIFNTYCDLLDTKSIMTAGHLAANLGKIAKVKPNLQHKITNALLNINKTHHEESRKDLIRAYVIESFSEYFDEIENKEEIIEFVKKQLDCKSPKTRKIAEKFLKKFN